MLTRSLLISAALYGANSLSIGDDRHKTYHDILKVIESNDISSVEVSSNRTVGMTSGYFVTTVYTTMTCAKNSEFTASGTTLGSCISATADSSYRYTSCSQSGSKTVVGMDSCTSGDCSSGCSSFDVPFDTGCQTMSMMTCSSQDEPWRAYDFDYHALMYYGSDDCGGDFDMWTAVDADLDDDCSDMDCYSYDNSGTSYSMEGFCD